LGPPKAPETPGRTSSRDRRGRPLRTGDGGCRRPWALDCQWGSDQPLPMLDVRQRVLDRGQLHAAPGPQSQPRRVRRTMVPATGRGSVGSTSGVWHQPGSEDAVAARRSSDHAGGTVGQRKRGHGPKNVETTPHALPSDIDFLSLLTSTISEWASAAACGDVPTNLFYADPGSSKYQPLAELLAARPRRACARCPVRREVPCRCAPIRGRARQQPDRQMGSTPAVRYLGRSDACRTPRQADPAPARLRAQPLRRLPSTRGDT
jgi:hypothetical protein